MRSILKTLLILVSVGFSSSAFSQIYKMEQSVEDGNFKRLEKVCLDALEDKELKKLPEVYYYLSQAYFEQAKDEIYFEKNPDALKLAVKYMLKGMKKDEEQSTLDSDFSEIKEGVIEKYAELAEIQFNLRKYSKAIKMFDQINVIDSTNRFAYYMSGSSYIKNTDTAIGEQHFRNLIKWYNDDLKNGFKDAEQTVEPHIYFVDKCWQNGDYDSAKYWLKNGREIFDDDAKLNYFDREVTKDKIANMPPSGLLLDYVQEVLEHSIDDKDFLHKENSIYMYLIKNSLTNGNLANADALIDQFVGEKVARASHKQARKIKETDVFVEKKAENVLWKLAEYFQTYKHMTSAKHVLNKYIKNTATDNTDENIAARWNLIAGYAIDTKAFPFAGFVLQQAIAKYPDNSDLLALRTKVIAEKEVVGASVDEQAALYELMKDEFAKNGSDVNQKKLIAINDKYIGLLAAANRFSTANTVMEEQMRLNPNIDHSERLRYLAREDFYQNYFMTRTKGVDINGNEIPLFEWSGSKSSCDAGEIDIDIQTKVANRINYFRRNAGVPEVFLDAATNEYCQKAALMMSSNNKLEHDPPRTWRCWSSEGAYAAKHSLIIKDANTTMAVTYIMDDKNPSAGNRRWLLYPNGKVYGHGSTNDIAVIWALDDSGSTDTSMYMDNPVCWPPKGDVPQMMMFSNWTFSIYRDLKDATVSVKQDGKVLDVEVEPFLRGYGAPTLVFKPAYNKAALPDKSDFEVTVTLSDGRKYNYTVRSFFYNPGR